MPHELDPCASWSLLNLILPFPWEPFTLLHTSVSGNMPLPLHRSTLLLPTVARLHPRHLSNLSFCSLNADGFTSKCLRYPLTHSTHLLMKRPHHLFLGLPFIQFFPVFNLLTALILLK